MIITEQDIRDMVVTTLRNLGPPTFVQAAQRLADYEVFPIWFKKDRVQLTGGTGIRRTIMLRTSNTARFVGLTDEDTPVVSDLMEAIEADWTRVSDDWSFERRQVLMNAGDSFITDVIVPKRIDTMLNIVDKIESGAFSAPSSSSDRRSPLGLPYWVCRGSGTGFTGRHPTGHTSVGGINADENPNWRNYYDTYSAFTKSDLIRKMRRAWSAINFKSPVDIKDYVFNRGVRYRCYCNSETMRNFEELAENQNENLGRDLASIDGVSLSFRGSPIREIKYLDNDSNFPIYMIDHSKFMTYVLKGDYMRESEPTNDRTNHNWFTIYVDCTYQHISLDRRGCALLEKV